MPHAPTFDRSGPLETDIVEDYFRALVSESKDFLKNGGFTINFAGYTATIKEYNALKIDDYEQAWKIAKDLSTWIEYLGDMYAYIQRYVADAETDKKSVQASVSTGFDSAKVTRGNRYSDMDDRVVDARKTRNMFKSLEVMLEQKIDALEKMHYLCQNTYKINKDPAK